MLTIAISAVGDRREPTSFDQIKAWGESIGLDELLRTLANALGINPELACSFRHTDANAAFEAEAVGSGPEGYSHRPHASFSDTVFDEIGEFLKEIDAPNACFADFESWLDIVDRSPSIDVRLHTLRDTHTHTPLKGRVCVSLWSPGSVTVTTFTGVKVSVKVS